MVLGWFTVQIVGDERGKRGNGQKQGDLEISERAPPVSRNWEMCPVLARAVLTSICPQWEERYFGCCCQEAVECLDHQKQRKFPV